MAAGVGHQLFWADAGGSVWGANPDGSNPQALVTGQNSPAGVAVGANHLYWTSNGDSTLWGANLDGSDPRAIVTSGLAGAGLAVDASHLYFTAVGAGPGRGAIWRANLDGSNPVVLVTGQDSPFAVAVDANHLYWTNTAGYAAGAGTVNRVGLDGSNPVVLVSGLHAPFGVAANADHLSWTNALDGTITQANLDGTNPQTIVTVQGGQPQLLAVTPPLLEFTPSPYDYGQVTIGQGATQTFTLANSGGQATGALTVTLAGPAAFTASADTCTGASLAPGGSCTVTVRLAPASTTTVSATLTGASTNPAATATAALTGTGVLPSHLYWVSGTNPNFPSGTVNVANLDGTSPRTIVPGQDAASGVTVGF